METIKFLLVGGVVVLTIILIKRIIEGTKGKGFLKDFENRMDSCGFVRRIVVYDFFPQNTKKNVDNIYKHYWTVGIWFNYQKQLAALRLDKDTWNEIEVPFGKFQKVEVIEDGYSTATGGGVGYGGVVIGHAKLKDFSKGLQIRIVVGDINAGTHAYILKLYESTFGTTRINKSTIEYKSIEECARSIVDEIENIIMYNQNK